MSRHDGRDGSEGWHAVTASAVLDSLETDETGLSSEEASRRPDEHRRNELPVGESVEWWTVRLTGTVAPFLVHVGAMYVPPAQRVLAVAPVRPTTLVVLAAISQTVGLAVELHTLSRRRSRAGG